MLKKVLTLLRPVIPFLLIVSLSTHSMSEDEWIYTTQPGDNLWKLSKTHLVSLRYWKQLQELNNIEDPLHIPVGKTIRFPVAWLKAGSSVGQIVALKGDVTVTDGGGTQRKAYENMILWENYTIETKNDSSVTLQFSDGSRLQLLDNSDLALGGMTTYGATGMAKTRAHLNRGRTESKVTPKTGAASRFEISTPSAIAAVRGTKYRMATADNGDSRTEVLKGAVAVQSGPSRHLLPKGYGMVTHPDKAPLEPVQLLTPPDISNLPKTIQRLPALLALESLDSATAYRMQIAEDPEFSAFLHDTVSTTQTFACPDLPDGSYFLRVRGIDENGLEGLDSVMDFTMQAHPFPPLPVAPAAEAVVSDTTVTFQWSEPEDAFRYQFLLGRDKDFSDSIVKKENIAKPAITLDLDLAPGLYFWGVATTDTSGKTGPLSDPQPLRRAPLAPEAPDTSAGNGSITIRWQRGAGAERYRCQVAKDPGFTSMIADEIIEQAQYQFATSSYGSYYIRLAAIDTDGYQGPFSPYQRVAIPAPSYLGWIVPAAIMLVILL